MQRAVYADYHVHTHLSPCGKPQDHCFPVRYTHDRCLYPPAALQPQPDILADVAFPMLGEPYRSLDPRRRNLENVSIPQRSRFFEPNFERPAHPSTIIGLAKCTKPRPTPTRIPDRASSFNTTLVP